MFSTPDEDEMGSPEPSAGALEAARRLLIHTIGKMTSTAEIERVARALDAYAAAALTDEQRDVLTVWGWMKASPESGLWGDCAQLDSGPDGDCRGEYVDTIEEFNGPDWLHAAATWVREQGAK